MAPELHERDTMKPEHKRRVIENELYACGIHSRWMPPGLRKAVKRQSHKIDRLRTRAGLRNLEAW